MTKLENKNNKMSAIYSNNIYSKIYLAWHEGEKIWHAISNYDNHIDYFKKLNMI